MVTILRSALWLLACLVLAGCASQPDGSHSFTVAATDEESGIWKLDGLAGSGRIDLTMNLRGEGADAASATLKFNYRGERFQHWDHDVDFDDRTCRGAYTVAFSHEHGPDRFTDYLATRLPWEQTAHVRLEWRSGGRFAVTVNGREQKVVESVSGIRNLVIEVDRGEMVVENLTYTRLTSDAPLLPPEPAG